MRRYLNTLKDRHTTGLQLNTPTLDSTSACQTDGQHGVTEVHIAARKTGRQLYRSPGVMVITDGTGWVLWLECLWMSLRQCQ